MKPTDILTGLDLRVQGHLKIFEYENRQQWEARNPARLLLNRRNAIHKDNVAILAAKTLTNRTPCHITYMVFGNGGTTVDSTGTVIFNTPNDTGLDRDLYNQVYFSLVDDTLGALAGNQMSARHITNSLFSDCEIRCLVGQNEPFGQLPANTLPTITEPTAILNINTEKFAFDEIGLKLADGTLVTHVMFVPLVKTASSLLEVIYTLRVAINDVDFIPPPPPPPPISNSISLTGVSAASAVGSVAPPSQFQTRAIQLQNTDFWNFPAMTTSSTGTMSCWVYLPPMFGFVPFAIDDFTNLVGGGTYVLAAPSETALYMGPGGTLNFHYGIVTVSNSVNAVITIDGNISGIPDIGSQILVSNIAQSGYDPGPATAHRRVVNVLSRSGTSVTTDWDTSGYTAWNPLNSQNNGTHLQIGYVSNVTTTNPAVLTTSLPHGIPVGAYISLVGIIGNFFGFAGGPPPIQVISASSNTLTLAYDGTGYNAFTFSPTVDGGGSRIFTFNAIEYFFNSSSSTTNALLSALVPFYTARTTTPLPNSQWVNLLVSWDMGQASGQKKLSIYHHDTAVTPVMTDDYSPSFTIPYGDGIPVTDGTNGWKVGGNSQVYADSILGYMAEFWFAEGVFMDFSDPANRHKFHDAVTGKAISLGPTGDLPTGSSPKIYLSLKSDVPLTPDPTLTFVDPHGWPLDQSPGTLGGIPNSSTMVLSFWCDRNTNGSDVINGRGIFATFDYKQLPIFMKVELYDASFNAFGFSFTFDGGTGCNICMCVDTNHTIGNKIVKVYVNNVLTTVTVYRDDANNMTIQWTDGSSDMSMPSGLSGYLADLWFAPGQFFDPQFKFMQISGNPVDLLSDGSGPSGTAPSVFFHLNSGDPATAFATNRGTGGSFPGSSNNFTLTNGNRFSDNLSGAGTMRLAAFTSAKLAPTSPTD